MKTPLLLCLFAVTLALTSHAAEDRTIAAVRAADDARVAAMVAGDRTALAATYSDGLTYAHSTGVVDNRDALLEGTINGPVRFNSIDYKQRTFVPAGPGVMLMKGRAVVNMTNKANGTKNSVDLNYLAVWREENGKWRLFAWQSGANPPGL